MSTKTNAQLQEELSAALADRDELEAKLANTKATAREEIKREKAVLRLQAEGNEQIRQDELAVATEGYEALFERAGEIYKTQESLDPTLLGTPGKVARDGIMSVLSEVFGEL